MERQDARAVNTFVRALPITEEVQECRSCHIEKASYLGNPQSKKSKMDGFACHEKHEFKSRLRA